MCFEMYSKYTTEELEKFAIELNEVIEARKFDELMAKVTDEVKQKCREAYQKGGMIPAIKELRIATNENILSLRRLKFIIEGLVKEEDWQLEWETES